MQLTHCLATMRRSGNNGYIYFWFQPCKSTMHYQPEKMHLLNRVTSLSKHTLIVAKHVLGKSILCQPLSTPTLTIARSPNAG